MIEPLGGGGGGSYIRSTGVLLEPFLVPPRVTSLKRSTAGPGCLKAG